VFILTCIVSAALQTITNEPPTAFRTINPILDQDWDSIPAEYKRGEDWEATFNKNSSHQFDVSLLHTFAHTGPVQSVHFSSDGKYLATGTERTAHIFDLQTGQRTSTVTDSDEITNPMRIVLFRSVRFSPDGGSLAVGAENGSLRIWAINDGNIITERSIRTLVGHHRDALVYSLDWSRNGRLLASGSNDSSVRLWDVETGVCVLAFDAVDPVDSLAFSPDGKLVATGSDSQVSLWDTENSALVEILSGHMEAVSSIAFSPDGRHLLSGSYDHTVRYWELGEAGRLSGVCKTTFRGHRAPVLSAAMTPDGEWAISGGDDKTLQFWNPVDGQPQFVLKGHTNSGN
jgi:general transcriptional corepressor TUP1